MLFHQTLVAPLTYGFALSIRGWLSQLQSCCRVQLTWCAEDPCEDWHRINRKLSKRSLLAFSQSNWRCNRGIKVDDRCTFLLTTSCIQHTGQLIMRVHPAFLLCPQSGMQHKVRGQSGCFHMHCAWLLWLCCLHVPQDIKWSKANWQVTAYHLVVFCLDVQLSCCLCLCRLDSTLFELDESRSEVHQLKVSDWSTWSDKWCWSVDWLVA